jgi:hypothetical protein
MTLTWTSAERDRIGSADELDIAARRRDGSLRSPTTVWVVRCGDDLFVRSYRGHDGAYRAKYRDYGAAYVDPMTAAAARSTTTRLVPR